MKKIALVGATVLCVFLSGVAESRITYIHAWDTDFYFGHVIFPEARHDGKDPLIFREGREKPEVADLNVPIVPGDTIKTGERRCEIQFDTGTIVRLDRDSEIKVETILTQSLSSRNGLTNLVLSRGRTYVMFKRYIRREIFQVLTRNAAVKMDHKSVALIRTGEDGHTDVQVNEGKVHVLFGPDPKHLKTQKLKSPGTATVTHERELILGNEVAFGEFGAWNEKMNSEFLALHEGKAFIPKPIVKLPRAVYEFAQKYSTLHGEWMWDSLYGYVWRPFLNDRQYPWGGWAPYIHGRWTSVNGQLFWVPAEPWGWVPYHLGIWVWDEKKGWLWIPGSLFAPAWVDWAFYAGSWSWRPWTIFDWYFYDNGGYSWAFLDMPPSSDPGARPILRKIKKDQLHKEKAKTYPMPKELKKVYRRVVAGMDRQDERIVSALRQLPRMGAMVPERDLNAPHLEEKVIRVTHLPAERQTAVFREGLSGEDSRQAARTFLRNEKRAVLREKITTMILGRGFPKAMASGTGERAKARAQKSLETGRGTGRTGPASSEKQVQALPSRSVLRPGGTRFLDWNPDVKVARRAGVSILYSSRTNEVVCPELRLTSRQVRRSRGYAGPSVRLGSHGVVVSSGGTAGSGGSSGSSSGHGASSHSSGGSSGGKGGAIKN